LQYRLSPLEPTGTAIKTPTTILSVVSELAWQDADCINNTHYLDSLGVRLADRSRIRRDDGACVNDERNTMNWAVLRMGCEQGAD